MNENDQEAAQRLEAVTAQSDAASQLLEAMLAEGKIDEFEYGKIYRDLDRVLRNYEKRKTPQDHLFLSPEVLASSSAAREIQGELDALMLQGLQTRVETVEDPNDPNLLKGWTLFDSCFDSAEMDSLADTREYVKETQAGETDNPFIFQVINVPGPKGSQVASALSGNFLETEAGESFGAIGYLATREDLHQNLGGATVTPIRQHRHFGTILANGFAERCQAIGAERSSHHLGTLLEARSGSEHFWITKFGSRYVCIKDREGNITKVPYFCPSLDKSDPEPVAESLAFRPTDANVKELSKDQLLRMVQTLMDDWYADGVDMEKVFAEFKAKIKAAEGEKVLLLNEEELAQAQAQSQTHSGIKRALRQ